MSETPPGPDAASPASEEGRSAPEEGALVPLTYERARELAEQLSPADPTAAILPLSVGPLPWSVVVLRLESQARIPVTYLLMGINIADFLLLESLGGSRNVAALLLMGVNLRSLVVENGQYFRFLTCMFMHMGLMHILSNMLGLWSLGRTLEYLYGSSRFVVLYLLAGLVGSAVSILLADALSAGASGAIFGLLGLAVTFPLGAGKLVPAEIKKRLIWSSAPWLLFNLYITFSDSKIDVGAHLGGLLVGLISGYVMASPRLNPWSASRLSARVGLALALLVCAGLLIQWGYWLFSVLEQAPGVGIGGP